MRLWNKQIKTKSGLYSHCYLSQLFLDLVPTSFGLDTISVTAARMFA